MRILICPDKFRGTATALAAAQAIAEGLSGAAIDLNLIPLADGGEGTLAALGGSNRVSYVSGPLGDPIEAKWRISGGRAVIEMAEASGLLVAGGAEGNDPIAATTSGTGELISEARTAGARRIVVGVGGSASTDGGLGAIRAMEPLVRFSGVELRVACDVDTRFLEAPSVFGPQKGATEAQIELLERRLRRLSDVYLQEYGTDVTDLQHSGAAGGLAGGLAAIGAQLVNGFELIAEEVALEDAISAADLVITGEGRLDTESFNGKVVGGVAAMAKHCQIPVVAVVGSCDPGVVLPDGMTVHSLVETFGSDRAYDQTTRCLTNLGTQILTDL
ncbi:MAG: glycerate kinase [Acidimicrobiales bacterium]|nr:glycerate kinase [Acidimicrobiales bacterium]HJM00110.1 glycerate kinase [Acidimicrobiales bacterium]